MKLYWLPTINAAIEVGKNNSSQALVDLEPASPYELGLAGVFTYQDFFTLWKDADPDIPILREAKAEYAKLR